MVHPTICALNYQFLESTWHWKQFYTSYFRIFVQFYRTIVQGASLVSSETHPTLVSDGCNELMSSSNYIQSLQGFTYDRGSEVESLSLGRWCMLKCQHLRSWCIAKLQSLRHQSQLLCCQFQCRIYIVLKHNIFHSVFPPFLTILTMLWTFYQISKLKLIHYI